MGVNNSPTIFRPTMWTYGDSTVKFHQAIWFDPGILKFVPIKRMKDQLRIKQPDGTFVLVKDKAKNQPGVVFYKRNADFKPTEEWLWEPSVNWGNGRREAEQNGHPRTINIMFTVLKLLFYLGVKKVYLLGCDFKMQRTEEKGVNGKGKEHYFKNYAFGQGRTLGAIGCNNAAYHKMNIMLKMLKPYFEKAGLRVFNCNPDSGLKAFPFMSYDDAIVEATRLIPKVIDAEGWYEIEDELEKDKKKEKDKKRG